MPREQGQGHEQIEHNGQRGENTELPSVEEIQSKTTEELKVHLERLVKDRDSVYKQIADINTKEDIKTFKPLADEIRYLQELISTIEVVISTRAKGHL